jgi:hypothetical protein
MCSLVIIAVVLDAIGIISSILPQNAKMHEVALLE